MLRNWHIDNRQDEAKHEAAVVRTCSAVGRDLFAYLTLMVNPASDGSLNRVFKAPARGIAVEDDSQWHAPLDPGGRADDRLSRRATVPLGPVTRAER